MKFSPLFAVVLALFLFSCTSKKNTVSQADAATMVAVDSAYMEDAPPVEGPELDAMNVSLENAELNFNQYKAAKTRSIDILHTSLDVKFDYENQQLNGKATIELQPYYKPISSIDLDAKGFDIHGVMLVEKSGMKSLEYKYNDSVLQITLDKTYTKAEKIKVLINYTAKPNELKSKGSDAITSAKGLYFINPLRKDNFKPRQVWTQGETEASSAWFPTFDSPNERMTSEIMMTVDTGDITLSNGVMVSSKKNTDGTHTDHWKMNQPHAPYLVMMAVGPFSVYKDKWRGKEVNYYLEKNYGAYAKDIFGNTPEMLEFYSKVLGVDYPWDKFSQIVVREFVSGAMENTTAVVHYDALNQTKEELLDYNHEEIIAHELFHHWFGDYVTCKVWGQLPLNESFATYGEYLWFEHKYGKDEADLHIYEDLVQYLSEAESKQEKMIRATYTNPEDMFDGHSYQKGGRILHMLRKYLGDDAFFKSLQHYLNKHKLSAVEIHQLRQSIEDITGEDLTWFFDQWFFTEGHPVLDVSYTFDRDDQSLAVRIDQKNSADRNVVYKLPTRLQIIENGKSRFIDITINEKEYYKVYDVDAGFEVALLDPERNLLAVITENHDAEQMSRIVNNHYGSFVLRKEKIEKLSPSENMPVELYQGALRTALQDPFWGARNAALTMISSAEDADLIANLESEIKKLAESDAKTLNKGMAISLLGQLGKEEYKTLFQQNLNGTPAVRSAAVLSLHEIDSMAAAEHSFKALATENSKQPFFSMLYIASRHATADRSLGNYFRKASNMADQQYIYYFISTLCEYLKRAGSEDEMLELIPLLDQIDYKSNFFAAYIFFGQKNELLNILNERKQKLENQNNPALQEKINKLNKVIVELEKAGTVGQTGVEE